MNFESIHNYYEPLVVARIRERFAATAEDDDFLEDVACVALNHLPARYVRHSVDLAFYMTPDERAAIDQAVTAAVDRAIAFVSRHRGLKRPVTITQP